MNKDAIKKLRKMTPAQLYVWGVNMYKQGFIDGLREGESEFDDAVILTEEEAKAQMPEEIVERILRETG